MSTKVSDKKEQKTNYTGEDFDVFILTHNRSKMLEEALISILQQDVKLNHITILDNESTDDTEQIAKKYEKNGVKYVKTYGFGGNYSKAQELAKQEYTMIFHDDDLLHPEYFSKLILALNNIDRPAFITTCYQWVSFNNINETQGKKPTNNKLPQKYLKPEKLKNKYMLFETIEDFTALMIAGQEYSPGYSATVYRTDLFKEINPVSEIYGKANDRAILINLSAKDRVVVLMDNNALFMRKHKGQDTYATNNALSMEQIYNITKLHICNMPKKDKNSNILYLKLLSNTEYLFNLSLSKEEINNFPYYKFINKLYKEKLIPIEIKDYFNRRVNVLSRIRSCIKKIKFKNYMYKQYDFGGNIIKFE